MFAVLITEKGGAQRRMEFDKPEVTIGRVQGNDIILPKGNVSKRHSRIVLKDNRFIVVDLKSTNGTYVNGRKITSPLVVKGGDKIYVGDFILTVEEMEGAGMEAGDLGRDSMDAMPPSARPEPPPAASVPPPPSMSSRPPAPSVAPPSRGTAPAAQAPPPLPRKRPPPTVPEPDSMDDPPSESVPSPSERFRLDEEPAEEMAPPPARATRQPPPQQQPQATAPPPPIAPSASQPIAPSASRRGALPAASVETGLRAVMKRVAREFDVVSSDPQLLHDQNRWAQAENVIGRIVSELEREGVVPRGSRETLAPAALQEAVGLGPLEGLLSNESVREIVVEGNRRIVADMGDGFEPVAGSFSSSDAVLHIARRLIAQTGQSLDPSVSVHEGSLPYGPHVVVILPPVAVRGPIIQIRMSAPADPGELIARAMASPEMLELMKKAVRAKRNVVVTGAVGAGVTSVVSALANMVGREERVMTVEDVPDLAIDRQRVLSLTVGSARGHMTMREVLRQANRLRCDRLVIDGARGSEVIDVLTTLAARGEGCLAGVHVSGTADSAVDQLRTLAHLDNHASDAVLTRLIASSMHLLVHVERAEDGECRITQITEIKGARGTGDTASLSMQDLFTYDNGFEATGSASF